MSEEKNINLVLKHEEDNEKPILTLHTIIEQTRRVLILWLVLAVIVGVLAGGFAVMDKTSKRSVQTIVEFTFDGVEKGKDPNGNEFDPTKIKSPAVLDGALTALGMDIPVDKLRDNIAVRGIMSEKTYQELTGYKSIFDSGNSSAMSAVKAMLDVSNFPTRYQIVLNLDQAELSETQGAEVLDAIVDAYKRYFFETYGYNQALGTAILSVDYSEYDYERVIEVFDTTLTSAQNYVKELSAQDGTNFRSVATGYSFADLVSALETIRAEDLDWISSYITVNNATKDKEQLLIYYEYRIQSLQRTKTAAETNLVSIQNSIETYQKDPVLVIPGGGESGNTTVGQTSKQYDDMIRKKLEVQEQITQCTKDITYLEYRITKLQDTSTVTSKAQMKVLDEKLEALHNKISKTLEIVNQTADEFYENVAYASACTVIAPATVNVSSQGANLMKTVIFAEAVLFAVFALLILIRASAQQYRLNMGKTKEATVVVEADVTSVEEEKTAEPETAKPVQKKNRK